MDSLLDQFLDRTHLSGLVIGDWRSGMNRLLEEDEPTLPSKGRPLLMNPTLSSPSTSRTLSLFFEIFERLTEELSSHLNWLLSLNPSRRDAILQHLCFLSGQLSHLHKKEFLGGLKGWIESPKSPQQELALKTYLQETAFIALSQAILLKAWSDQHQRPLEESDLGQLNWALNSSLRPFVPVDREGWQITRPNLYSWYNPSKGLQEMLWNLFQTAQLSQESPLFLFSLWKACLRPSSEMQPPCGYDTRFYQSIWENLAFFYAEQSTPGLQTPQKERTVFCPTLRDAGLMHTAVDGFKWMGAEVSPFLFFLMELTSLWRKPKQPLDWVLGTALEAHSRHQMAFDWTPSQSSGQPALPLSTLKQTGFSTSHARLDKPLSVLHRMIDMEACDLGFVLEEEIVRTSLKQSAGLAYKQLIEQLPYFKKLKTAQTSLGTLQACLALTKLRQGALLWWAREEAIGSQEGGEALHFLLNRAQLLVEWDLSQVAHHLPGTHQPLFPKYLYLFQRETKLEARSEHVPCRYSIQGQLKSHIELPLLLQDLLLFHIQPLEPRGAWTIHPLPSGVPQKQWVEKWPERTSFKAVQQLDWLLQHSSPLAQHATIQPTPTQLGKKQAQWTLSHTQEGFWVFAHEEPSQEKRSLSVQKLPAPGEWVSPAGLLVFTTHLAPFLKAYLRSPLVHLWLENHTEKKGNQWQLHEQVLKCLPVANILLDTFKKYFQQKSASLPDPWPALLKEQGSHSKIRLQKALQEELSPHHPQRQLIHAACFLQTALDLEKLDQQAEQSFSFFQGSQIHWGRLIRTYLPPQEQLPLSLHPKIRLVGHLPPHLPIIRMDRLEKGKQSHFLLLTESGFHLQIHSDSSLLNEVIWSQLQTATHSTWTEVLQSVALPKFPEALEERGMELLKKQTEYLAAIKIHEDLLDLCQWAPLFDSGLYS